jgi:hypothetical protein
LRLATNPAILLPDFALTKLIIGQSTSLITLKFISILKPAEIQHVRAGAQRRVAF